MFAAYTQSPRSTPTPMPLWPSTEAPLPFCRVPVCHAATLVYTTGKTRGTVWQGAALPRVIGLRTYQHLWLIAVVPTQISRRYRTDGNAIHD